MDVSTVPWHEFMRRFHWKQGEHIAIIAPTGGGKTTLELAIMGKRSHNIFFATKPQDPMYKTLLKGVETLDGRKLKFKRVQSFDEVMPWDNNILLWPAQRKTIPATYEAQKYAFRHALNRIVQQGRWTLWFDECKYMVQLLSMEREITYVNEQLRSMKGTAINVAQRPVWLSKSVLGNATHVFLWNTRDRDDAKKLSDIGGIDARMVAAESQSLSKHEFLYINTRGTQADVLRSQVRK